MKIEAVEAYLLSAPPEERPHWVSHYPVHRVNELLVRVLCEGGVSGVGLGSGRASVAGAAELFARGLKELVVGEDALSPERLYEHLFRPTYTREGAVRGWGREELLVAAAALDIALWDVVGKAGGLPLWRLFGGYRSEVPAYVTCGYYREGKDLGELRAEMEMLLGQGHRAFKMKAGGLPLGEDVERVRAVREAIGEERELMVDVNMGWDLATAGEGARRLEEFHPRWLEEPIHWYDDRRGMKLLAQKTAIPLSAGESEKSPFGCRDLVEEGAIEVLQFDTTRMGGITWGRKLVALAELHHVWVAPHHDPFIHAHLVGASPRGLICESFTDPERDPLQAELFLDPPRIEGGVLYLKESPGLGLEVNPEALKRYGRRVA